MQTNGLSPKLIASAITGLIVLAVANLGLKLDPAIEQAINVAAMLAAVYIARPGNVTTDPAELHESVPGERDG